jgi:hypothetical protein
MLGKFVKHTNKILVFVINILVLIIGVFVIKSKNNDVAVQVSTTTDMSPVNPEVLASQEAIVLDRENKLRDLNSSPKQIQQNNVITTTTTTATTPPKSTTSSSSSKTKTS